MLVTEPALAVIVTVPTTKPVAKPVFVPMTALVVLEELQFTEVVISSALPSAKNPVAVNCWELGAAVPDAETVARVGEIRIDCRADVETSSSVDAARLPDVAVTVVVPADTPVATPFPSMVAITPLPVLQVTEGVVVLPSLFLPVAVNWVVPLMTTSGLAGLIEIEASEELEPPQLESVRAMPLTTNSAKTTSTRFDTLAMLPFDISIRIPFGVDAKKRSPERHDEYIGTGDRLTSC